MNNVVNLRAHANVPLIPTLVLLDLQQEYTASPRLFSIPDIETALENCHSALALARQLGLPVAFLRMIGRAPFFNPALSYSHWIPGFQPLTSEMVFERSKPSCYANRDFAEAMSQGGGHYVLAGFSGESGCLATAIEAFHRGHRVTFLADASASHSLNEMSAPTVHDTIVQLIGLYADVSTTRAWIEGQTKNLLFREVR
jgi:nicotinamidase-related amidase